MSKVVSIRVDDDDYSALKKRAKAQRLTLGRYCRRVLERGADDEDGRAAIRAEVRAGVERTEAAAAKQAAAIQGLIDTLTATLGPGA
jgi:predicted transcriptional regulator